jgi:hypothetical protein
MRSVSFIQVGNGNFSLLQIDDTNILVDLKNLEDKTSWETVKPFLRKDGKKYVLDVLCISHGDQDHCGGYAEFQKQMDEGKLVIGSIWHSKYDRTDVTEEEDLPDDYLKLRDEILRREKIKSPKFGDIVVPLTAWDDEKIAFAGLKIPDNFTLKVLSPYAKDEGDTDWDVNDFSIVLNISISGLKILFTGDSGAEIWQQRIVSHTLKKKDKADWANAEILVASHHGSYSFFGTDRDDVLNAEPYPDNYNALNYIDPGYLIVSASSKFPTNGDESGDLPPHYAAWKWYHQWFQENKGVKKSDKHPAQFKYTSDGHVHLKLGDDEKWTFKSDWTPDDDPDRSGDVRFVNRGGTTKRPETGYA